MKRFQGILIIVLCLILLVGCKQSETVQAEHPKATETAAPEIGEDEILIDPAGSPESVPAVPEPTPPETTQKPEAVQTHEAFAAETPAPVELPQTYVASDGVYTIAWMSDPQHYSKKFPETYYAMTGFLRDHREEMNLAYIINTGDLVHNTDLDSEWDVADRAQAMIDEIPNGVLAGNHDILDPIGYKTFCARFGEKRYQNKPWYGGSYENNRGHYDLLTIGETDYLFVYMGFAPSQKGIDWVRGVFKQYPDRMGVLCLHDYYTKTQTLSEDGKRWHDQVVRKTPNLYMVLCGHKYGAYCFPESFDDDGDGKDDRTVYQMLFNYQASLRDGGGGYLRLMQINEAEGTMHNLTYSPVFEDFNRFDDPANREEYYPFDEKNEEFVLPLPWKIKH